MIWIECHIEIKRNKSMKYSNSMPIVNSVNCKIEYDRSNDQINNLYQIPKSFSHTCVNT